MALTSNMSSRKIFTFSLGTFLALFLFVAYAQAAINSNVLAVVCIDDPSGDGIASNAVTVGGQTATFVGKGNRGDGRFGYMYFATAVPFGDQKISVANPSAHNIMVNTTSYQGVAETGQPDSTPATSNWVTQVSATYSYTTVADNSWLLACVDNGTTIVAGANTALRGMDSDPRTTDSRVAQTPAGVKSLAWTFASASGIAIGISASPVTGSIIKFHQTTNPARSTANPVIYIHPFPHGASAVYVFKSVLYLVGGAVFFVN